MKWYEEYKLCILTGVITIGWVVFVFFFFGFKAKELPSWLLKLIFILMLVGGFFLFSYLRLLFEWDEKKEYDVIASEASGAKIGDYITPPDDYIPLKTAFVKIFSRPWVLSALLFSLVVTLIMPYLSDSLSVVLSSSSTDSLLYWGWVVILSFLICTCIKILFFEAIRNLLWIRTRQLLWEKHYVKVLLMLIVIFFIWLLDWVFPLTPRKEG